MSVTGDDAQPSSEGPPSPAEADPQVSEPARPIETGPEPPSDMPAPGGRLGWSRRTMVLVVLILVGLAGVGSGGTALGMELTRHATPAEANAAGQLAQAQLWERRTAGQIFPSTIGYQSAFGYDETASLVGIGTPVSCASATDPALARVLRSVGCLTMLRATYADPARTVIATVGIAVLPSPAAARRVFSVVNPNAAPGLRAVAFAGTVSAAFSDSAREVFGSESTGPYVVYYTAGYADGRTTTPENSLGETTTTDLGTGLLEAEFTSFSASGAPCSDKDVRC